MDAQGVAGAQGLVGRHSGPRVGSLAGSGGGGGTAPAITTTPVVGAASTAAPVTWPAAVVTGSPAPAVVYDVLIGGGVVAANATSGSYTPTGHVGGSLVVRTTATNSVGSAQASSSAVVVSAAAVYTGQIGTRGIVHQQVTTFKQARFARREVAVDDVTSPQFAFLNWYVDSQAGGATYAETGCGGVATWTAAVEYPIGNPTRTQVLFSGVATGTVADAGTLFGFATGLTIPAGQPFIVHSFVQFLGTGAVATTGNGNSASTTLTPTYDFSLGDQTDMAASGLTDNTMGGAYLNNQPGFGGGHFLCLGSTVKPSVYNVGTSIDHGQNGDSNAQGVEGIISRSVVQAGGIGFANCGVRGDYYAFSKTGSAKRAALRSRFSHMVLGGPVNDIYARSQTAAQTLASCQSLYTLYSGMVIFQATCTVAGAGNSGTTPSVFEPIRATFNASLSPLPSGVTALFDTAAVLANAAVPGTWAFAGDTADGTHPTSQGYARVAASGAVNVALITR